MAWAWLAGLPERRLVSYNKGDRQGVVRTVLGLVILVGLHGLVGSGTTDELVAELGLVLLLGALVVLSSLSLAILWTPISATDSNGL